MGSAAAMPYPGKATRILARDSEVLNMRDTERGKTDPPKKNFLCGTCCVTTHLMSKHKKFKLNTVKWTVSENQIFSFTSDIQGGGGGGGILHKNSEETVFLPSRAVGPGKTVGRCLRKSVLCN